MHKLRININKSTIVIAILSVLLLTACKKTDRRFFPNEIESTPLTINRFDMDLIHLDTTNTLDALSVLNNKYLKFAPIFWEDVLGIPQNELDYLTSTVPAYLSDTLFQEVNQRVIRIFHDVSGIEKELGDVFAHLTYLYPTLTRPEVYSYVSGFTSAFTMQDNIYAIGLDMYLGSDYKHYSGIVHEYQRPAMNPESIAIDIVSAYVFNHFRLNQAQHSIRLLDDMMYRGKMMYMLSKLFHERRPEEIIGYTREQWEWCEQYENQIWNTLLDTRALFTTDHRTITSYMNDAPFTAPISEASPGRLGTWIGMRIAQSYMEENQAITMQELITETNAQKILELSQYRPR